MNYWLRFESIAVCSNFTCYAVLLFCITFQQSRVGPVEWLKPYTEEAITELGKKGVENLLAVPIR